MTDAVFVSSHFDDAVLSCGGTIAAMSRQGLRVAVVTVFGGGPQIGAESAAAERFHRMWGVTGSDATELRRRENEEACRILGAEPIDLPFPDLIYRGAAEPGGAELAATVTARLRAVLGPLAPRQVFGPCGIGGHPDHVITRLAVDGLAAAGMLLYEDLPYGVAEPAASSRVPGTAAVHHYFTAADWERKVAAIEAYASQQEMLWCALDWRAALRGHSLDTIGGPLGERCWPPPG